MEEKKCFDVFNNHDRFGFPAGIHRITAGKGGESILICGEEKNVLLDCGMAYCGPELTENLKQTLKAETLDIILLSHSHYDHIGALPYVREAYPGATVLGAFHAQKILPRPGARKLMKELGETAREKYAEGVFHPILTEGLSVDRVIGDGDRIPLGGRSLKVMETKGHTDCSLSFFLEPDKILFASESTGILEKRDYVHTPILKSYEDAQVSFEKCKNCGAKQIVLPHFGLLPSYFNEEYWTLYEKELQSKRQYLARLASQGFSENEIFQKYADTYWNPIKSEEQPYEAFIINSRHIVKVLLQSLENEAESERLC